MSAKSQPQSRKPGGADDFRSIPGITRMIENQLHAAGILTFGQLAGSQPEYLAELLHPGTGFTTRHILEQDWITEARQRAQLHQQTNLGPARSTLVNEGFVVDLFLDANRDVQLTQVLHVRCDVGESWYGWDAGRLLGFLTRNANLAGTEPPGNAEPESEP